MKEIILELEDSELSFDRSFELAQYTSVLLNENYNAARILIINVLNNWGKVPDGTIEIWTDLIESIGFYPYLAKNIDTIKFQNILGELRNGLHKSDNLNKYFHEEQLVLLRLLQLEKNVIVSAPTSFGKSLLIEEIVASKKYKNIVVIQPTLALLDETRKKLVKYRNSYKLIVRTSQEPSTELGNIFLFTAERVNEYQLFTNVEFLVIDEFYKLSGKRDDERSSSLNNAFYYLMKSFNPKFYLLGPNIDGISPGFEERYDALFHKSSYSLVDSRSIDVYKQNIGRFGTRGVAKKNKELALFELLVQLKEEQSIIYCSSPHRARYLAQEYANYLLSIEHQATTHDYPLIDWIKVYINNEWCLLSFLNYDIGIHDGALQKHISTSIIDYFNQKKIKCLFCTSTIIEGVNTSAKNIIYFDPKKGSNDVDYFDYANIKGRAGRMMEHYVGKIYNFNEPPVDEQIIIDIPFFQQNPIKDEVLIQLSNDEVLDKESLQFTIISGFPENERELIKKNGVVVQGQKSLIDNLRLELVANHHLVQWNIPSYRQLEYILGLAWDYLIIPGETTRPMTKSKLIKMTFDYGTNKDINYLIRNTYSYHKTLATNENKSDGEIMDNAIQEVFQVMKHWFEYKVPKWLSVMNEIQRFICSEKGLRAGNYIYYANLIENDFLRENLSILAEYGIPSSAIRKLESKIPADIDQDAVLNYILENQLYNSENLLKYEQTKLIDNIL